MAQSLLADVDVLEHAPLPGDADIPELTALAEHTLKSEAAIGVWSIAIVLTTDAALRALHREFMDIDSETDVMTFPADDPSGGHGGDIVISVDRAAEQGPEWGHTTWQEIRFLAVHGVLHLCGWDDSTPELRDRMLERQRELIEAFESR